MRRTLVILSLLILGALPCSGQPWSGAAYVGRTYFTGYGGPGLAFGVAGRYRLSPAVTLSIDVARVRSVEEDEVFLIRGESDWHRRRHVRGAVDTAVYPLRVHVLGGTHRLGVGAGADLRYRADQLHQGTFFPQYFLDAPFSPEEVAGEWRGLGEGYEAFVFDVEAPSPSGQVGPHVALVFPIRGLEVGGHAGLRYGLSVGRVGAALHLDYRRFLDQKANTGTHTIDVRLGMEVLF